MGNMGSPGSSSRGSTSSVASPAQSNRTSVVGTGGETNRSLVETVSVNKVTVTPAPGLHQVRAGRGLVWLLVGCSVFCGCAGEEVGE
ncbi:hypothetical protein BC829DRAFT_281192 [Chytridium lagenaria]|nr:hypothetical protein BC829DRAFT_281192 [Chytridium lagenaria]